MKTDLTQQLAALREQARFVFAAAEPETPTVVNDVIEWFASSIKVLTEQQADADFVYDPNCKMCSGLGYYVAGHSGREDDGNAPIHEQCDCWIPVEQELRRLLQAHHDQNTQYSRSKSAANATMGEFKESSLSALIESGYLESKLGKQTVAMLAAAPSPDGKAEQAEAPSVRGPWVDYQPVYDFALKHRIPFNETAAMVRAAYATQPPAIHEQEEAPSVHRPTLTDDEMRRIELSLRRYTRQPLDLAAYGRACIEAAFSTQPTASPEQAEAPSEHAVELYDALDDLVREVKRIPDMALADNFNIKALRHAEDALARRPARATQPTASNAGERDGPSTFRKCEHCGCETNAKMRACCKAGWVDDKVASETRAALASKPPASKQKRCGYCDGTGDVHSVDGQWRGRCTCPAGQQPTLTQSKPSQDDLRDKLQRQCTTWGAYWRASDAHGVELTKDQAVELLRDALNVEVEIKDKQ